MVGVLDDMWLHFVRMCECVLAGETVAQHANGNAMHAAAKWATCTSWTDFDAPTVSDLRCVSCKADKFGLPARRFVKCFKSSHCAQAGYTAENAVFKVLCCTSFCTCSS